MRRLAGIVLILILALLICGASAYLIDYKNGTMVNVTAQASASPLVNYPVLFTLSNASGISGNGIVYTNGTTRSDWGDVNISAPSDFLYSFWLGFNESTSTTIPVLSNVTSITTSGMDAFVVHYGSTNITVSRQNPTPTVLQFHGSASANFNDPAVVNPVNTSYVVFGRTTTAGADVGVFGMADGPIAGAANNATIQPKATAPYFKSASTGSLTKASSLVITANTYYRWRINRTDNSAKYSISGNTTEVDITTNLPAVNLGLAMAKGTAFTQNLSYVRQWVPDEPTLSGYTLITPYQPAFTDLPEPSQKDEAVQFRFSGYGTPQTCEWRFGELLGSGGSTYEANSTLCNPDYAYSSTGVFNIKFNSSNSTSPPLVWRNITGTHTVYNTSVFIPSDIWMEAEYNQTFRLTNRDTLAPIGNVTIVSTSYGSTTTGTNGIGYLTTGFGTATITFSANGYITRSINYVFDSDEVHDVVLSPTAAAPIDIQGTPKDVKFHIQSFFGSPISNARVAAQGVSTTTGNWDWLAALLSINFQETPINNASMSGTTDTNGDIVFLMLDSIKYNITVTASGYTFPTTITAIQASQYTISANMNTSWFESGNDTVREVNVSVSWVPKNATWAFVNITYVDDTGTTTGGDIKIYLDTTPHKANASPIAVMNITSSSCTNSTLVSTPVGGASYTAIVNATTTGGNIVRSFVHSFKGASVNLPGWTPETQLWLAMFILIFTAAFAGVIHAPQMSVVVCLEAWIFWSIGWLDYLINGLWYEEVGIIGILVVATAVTIFWSLTEGKAKVKRSS